MLYPVERHYAIVLTPPRCKGHDYLKPLFEIVSPTFNDEFKHWVNTQEHYWRTEGVFIPKLESFNSWWPLSVREYFGLTSESLCKLTFVIDNLALFKKKECFSLAALEWAFDNKEVILEIKKYTQNSHCLLNTSRQCLDLHTNKFVYLKNRYTLSEFVKGSVPSLSAYFDTELLNDRLAFVIKDVYKDVYADPMPSFNSKKRYDAELNLALKGSLGDKLVYVVQLACYSLLNKTGNRFDFNIPKKLRKYYKKYLGYHNSIQISDTPAIGSDSTQSVFIKNMSKLPEKEKIGIATWHLVNGGLISKNTGTLGFLDSEYRPIANCDTVYYNHFRVVLECLEGVMYAGVDTGILNVSQVGIVTDAHPSYTVPVRSIEGYKETYSLRSLL